MSGVFTQLKRRNVFRVAAAYAIVGWLVLQIGGLLFSTFEAPLWVAKSLAVLVALGFPIACVLAWAFELTPEGVKRTVDVDESESITAQTGRKLDIFILVSLVALIGVTLWLRARPAPPPAPASVPGEPAAVAAAEPAFDPASIAVLPFINMSDDPAQEYFSDGISEELLNVLSRIDGLRVASRTSSFAYKGSPLRIPEIATELGVAFMVEGSVRKAGDQVRITAQLIDTRNDRHLWSNTYDRSLEDIFAVQTEIANAIAAALREPLGLELAPVEVRASTGDLDAYDLYLKGREAWLSRKSEQELRDGIAYLEQAVAMDPDFIEAQQDLANVYNIAIFWHFPDRPTEWYKAQIDTLTRRVLARDPNRPLALVTRVVITDPDPVTGWGVYLDLYRRAVEIDPDFTSGWLWWGQALAELGYLEEGLANIEKCLALEPRYPQCRASKLIVLVGLGRNTEARQKLEETILDTPDQISSVQFWVPWDLGERPLAIAMEFRDPVLADMPVNSLLSALLHPEVDRQRVASEWADAVRRSGSPLGAYADIFAALGVYARVDQSYSNAGWMWLPSFAGYRKSPEFKAMAVKRGLLTTWRHRGFPPQCRPLPGDDFECD